MLTMTESAEELRNRIIEDLYIMDMEELRTLYGAIAAIAAEKATKLADRDWVEKNLSREKIAEEVTKYRQSIK